MTTAAAAAVTVAVHLGAVSLSALAATPHAVASGRVWLLATSAVVADRPAVPSLVGFWIVGVAVLLVCSWRVVAVAAAAGHVLSTLGVYAAIGLVRVVDPSAFANLLRAEDYGVSAIIAAWLGAIARTLWSRFPSGGSRLLVALGSVGCAGIGLAFRPDVTFLDSEHLLAYAIGVLTVQAALRPRPSWPSTESAASAVLGADRQRSTTM